MAEIKKKKLKKVHNTEEVQADEAAVVPDVKVKKSKDGKKKNSKDGSKGKRKRNEDITADADMASKPPAKVCSFLKALAG